MINYLIRNIFLDDLKGLIDSALLDSAMNGYKINDDQERSIVSERLTERLINFVDDKYSVTEDQDF